MFDEEGFNRAFEPTPRAPVFLHYALTELR
jgi:hypothetical protein